MKALGFLTPEELLCVITVALFGGMIVVAAFVCRCVEVKLEETNIESTDAEPPLEMEVIEN